MKKSIGVVITPITVAIACLAIAYMFQDYLFHPWTRDGQVRAQIIQITSRVSGPIVQIPIDACRYPQI